MRWIILKVAIVGEGGSGGSSDIALVVESSSKNINLLDEWKNSVVLSLRHNSCVIWAVY